jgi:hypothetical protein
MKQQKADFLEKQEQLNNQIEAIHFRKISKISNQKAKTT